MIRLDPLADVRLTTDGPKFNRFSLQVVRILTSAGGPTFFNTAKNTHAKTIPNAIVIRTASTRIFRDPNDPPNAVRCASDNGKHPAPYISDPAEDLCLMCPNHSGGCIATTPVLVASREGSGWRVLRIDLAGENGRLARTWEQMFYVDWDLQYEADLSLGLDAQRTAELRLGDPRRLSRRHERELLVLWKLLQLMPMYAATPKAVRP